MNLQGISLNLVELGDTYEREACIPYKWVASHVWMSHVPCLSESWHTYEFVISQPWVNRTCPVHMCDMTHCLLHMCGMRYSYVWHDVFTRVTWLRARLTHSWEMTNSLVCHDALKHGTCVCDMTHSHEWRDSFIWKTYDELIGVSWLTQTWDMTHSHVRLDSFIWETCLSFICVTKFNKIQRHSLKIHPFSPD